MLKILQKSIPLVLFIAFAAYILLGFYQDMLFTLHMRTPFIGGSLFFGELMSEPFGLMRWIGCWLTQLCYYPVLGFVVYVLIWSSAYFFAEKTFRLPALYSSLLIIPLACLLLGIVDLGYWIYCMKSFGDLYAQSVAFLLMTILLYALCLMKTRYSAIIAAVVCFFVFPFIGWYSILLALCYFLINIRTFGWSSLYILLPVLAPGLWHSICYQSIPMTNMWYGGFPVFIDAEIYTLRLSAPYFVLVAFLVLFSSSVLTEKEEKIGTTAKKVWIKYGILTAVVSAVSYVGVWQKMFKDYNYLAEMRMLKCAMNEDWTGVLQEAQKQQTPSHSMVLLKNLALTNTGGLGEYGFKFTSNGIEIKNPDGLNIGPIQIVGPTVYANYGRINYATRWSHEFAVCYGYSPYYLMHLARTAKTKGEKAVESKYLSLLHSHKYYEDWMPATYSPLAKGIEMSYGNVIDSDNNNMEYFLMDTFSQSYGSDNTTVLELSLFNAMLIRDPERFWNAFVSYAQTIQGTVLPQHYQEAYFLFMEAAPVELPIQVSVSSGMAEAYTSFRLQYDSLIQMGYSRDKMEKTLQVKWGGSYWWYYFFAKQMI